MTNTCHRHTHVSMHSITRTYSNAMQSNDLSNIYILQDQCRREMAAGRVFRYVREAPITFRPTYKFDKHVADPYGYDTSAKHSCCPEVSPDVAYMPCLCMRPWHMSATVLSEFTLPDWPGQTTNRKDMTLCPLPCIASVLQVLVAHGWQCLHSSWQQSLLFCLSDHHRYCDANR